MKLTALPPLHLRPNDGWERGTNGCGLTITLLMFPGIRSSQRSPIVADFGRAGCLQSRFLLSAQLAATFWMSDKGSTSKHAGLRSWSEARWDWYLNLRLPLIASWFQSGAEELWAQMASVSKVSILDYFNIVFEGENGKIESNCKACGTRIQAKRSVTSNFVTHLKVIISKQNVRKILRDKWPTLISLIVFLSAETAVSKAALCTGR